MAGDIRGELRPAIDRAWVQRISTDIYLPPSTSMLC